MIEGIEDAPPEALNVVRAFVECRVRNLESSLERLEKICPSLQPPSEPVLHRATPTPRRPSLPPWARESTTRAGFDVRVESGTGYVFVPYEAIAQYASHPIMMCEILECARRGRTT